MVDIIRAHLHDVDRATPLFDAYRQFYKQSTDLRAARAFLAERLTNEQSAIYLAVKDSVSIGFVQLYLSFSSVSLKKLWILNDLYVMPQSRGQGVGTALLERARQHAEETQSRGLMLQTAVDNTTAQRVYERLGWKRDEDFYVYYLLF